MSDEEFENSTTGADSPSYSNSPNTSGRDTGRHQQQMRANGIPQLPVTLQQQQQPQQQKSPIIVREGEGNAGGGNKSPPRRAASSSSSSSSPSSSSSSAEKRAHDDTPPSVRRGDTPGRSNSPAQPQRPEQSKSSQREDDDKKKSSMKKKIITPSLSTAVRTADPAPETAFRTHVISNHDFQKIFPWRGGKKDDHRNQQQRSGSGGADGRRASPAAAAYQRERFGGESNKRKGKLDLSDSEDGDDVDGLSHSGDDDDHRHRRHDLHDRQQHVATDYGSGRNQTTTTTTRGGVRPGSALGGRPPSAGGNRNRQTPTHPTSRGFCDPFNRTRYRSLLARDGSHKPRVAQQQSHVLFTTNYSTGAGYSLSRNQHFPPPQEGAKRQRSRSPPGRNDNNTGVNNPASFGRPPSAAAARRSHHLDDINPQQQQQQSNINNPNSRAPSSDHHGNRVPSCGNRGCHDHDVAVRLREDLLKTQKEIHQRDDVIAQLRNSLRRLGRTVAEAGTDHNNNGNNNNNTSYSGNSNNNNHSSCSGQQQQDRLSAAQEIKRLHLRVAQLQQRLVENRDASTAHWNRELHRIEESEKAEVYLEEIRRLNAHIDKVNHKNNASAHGKAVAELQRALRERTQQYNDVLHRDRTGQQKIAEAQLEAARCRAAHDAAQLEVLDYRNRLEALADAPIQILDLQQQLNDRDARHKQAEETTRTLQTQVQEATELWEKRSAAMAAAVAAANHERDQHAAALEQAKQQLRAMHQAAVRASADADERIETARRQAASRLETEAGLMHDRERVLQQDLLAAQSDLRRLRNEQQLQEQRHDEQLREVTSTERRRQEALAAQLAEYEQQRALERQQAHAAQLRRIAEERAALEAEQTRREEERQRTVRLAMQRQREDEEERERERQRLRQEAQERGAEQQRQREEAVAAEILARRRREEEGQRREREAAEEEERQHRVRELLFSDQQQQQQEAIATATAATTINGDDGADNDDDVVVMKTPPAEERSNATNSENAREQEKYGGHGFMSAFSATAAGGDDLVVGQTADGQELLVGRDRSLLEAVENAAAPFVDDNNNINKEQKQEVPSANRREETVVVAAPAVAPQPDAAPRFEIEDDDGDDDYSRNQEEEEKGDITSPLLPPGGSSDDVVGQTADGQQVMVGRDRGAGFDFYSSVPQEARFNAAAAAAAAASSSQDDNDNRPSLVPAHAPASAPVAADPDVENTSSHHSVSSAAHASSPAAAAPVNDGSRRHSSGSHKGSRKSSCGGSSITSDEIRRASTSTSSSSAASDKSASRKFAASSSPSALVNRDASGASNLGMLSSGSSDIHGGAAAGMIDAAASGDIVLRHPARDGGGSDTEAL